MIVLFLVIDSLRADYLPEYGCINELAEKGINYSNAYSTGSVTKTSLPDIINNQLLNQLKELGFKTALIHCNPNIKDIYNVDHYRDLGNIKHSRLSRWINTASYIIDGNYWKNEKASNLNKEALKIIEETSEPLFLIIWYMDVHYPYLPDHTSTSIINRIKAYQLSRKMYHAIHSNDYSNISKHDLETLKNLYKDGILELDIEIEILLSKTPKSLIILTADHGDEFLEHGKLSHHYTDIPELRHIPLIIHSPHLKPKVIDRHFTHAELTNLILRKIRDHILRPETPPTSCFGQFDNCDITDLCAHAYPCDTSIPTRIKEET